MKKINIGFLGNQIAPGGGSASLLLMIKSLDKNKFNIYLISSDCANGSVKKEFEKYCKQVIVDKRIKQFVSCAGHSPKYTEYIKAIITKKKQINIISQFIESNNIDILHVNNAVFSHLYPAIKTKFKIKIVSHLREQVHLYGKKLLENKIVNNIQQYSDKIIGISDNELIPFSEKNKTVVMPNPFDFNIVKDIPKSDFRQVNNISDRTIIIGMMGRFAKDKGHLLFLKAANKIIDKIGNNNIEVRFVILGVNPSKSKWKLLLKKILRKEDYRETVMNYISKTNLSTRLILVPFIKDVFPILKEIDVYVRPSLTKDPWGRDIIEASALKRLIVATGSCQLFIKSGKTGFLVDATIPENLAETLFDVIKLVKEEKHIQIVDNAFQNINELCNLSKYGKKMEKIYFSL